MRKQKTLFAFLALAFLVAGGVAQTEPVEFGDGAKLIPRSFKEENKERMFEISAEYPELQGVNPAIAAGFNALVKTTVMEDVDRFRDLMTAMDEQDLKFARERGFSNYSETGYSVVLANRDLVSISFGNGSFSGGVHPNTYSFVINFDLKRGKALKLADLFRPDADYLKVISDYAIAELNKQAESTNDEWIATGAGPKEENFESWTLTAEGLNLEFDAYQVAPYVAGPQEVLIPYARLRSILRPLDFEPLRFADNGNPVNWCRNGLFPSDSDDFRIGRITGRRNEKVYFRNDDNDDCPDAAACKTRSYVVPGDEVIVSKSYGTYACSWYQPLKGSATVGWIPLDRVSMNETQQVPGVSAWIGNWDFYDNSIKITKGNARGSMKITGTAFWQGLGDNIHIGELDDSAVPNGVKMSFGSDGEYECRVKMQLAGRFLIVSDNLNCGGMNVTFNGVYRKK